MNLFLDASNNVKIGDLGVAKVCTREDAVRAFGGGRATVPVYRS